MTTTHEADLVCDALRPAARRAHIVPGLDHDCSLLSIGTLCDAGYTVTFDADHMKVNDDDQLILIGHRNASNGLWHVDLASPPIRFANSLGAPTSAELVTFAHASLFSPVLSTLETALSNNRLTNFPGLTLAALRKHPPQSGATIKGHQDQSRKNQRSTRPPPTVIAPDDDISEDANPPGVDGRSHALFAAVMEPTGQVYSDQTGRFVAPSSSGNNYLMVVYDYDSNHLFAQPFRNRTAKCILDAYKLVHARLVKAGLRPQLQRLDNECSAILKDFLQQENVDYQLVPPGVHRRNAAERGIRTFQNHFIAGLCSVDSEFPIHLWDRLVPQAELTLNLLRGSRINPKLSAWAQVNGTYDFNRTPIGPPGTRVLAHEKPSSRETWSPHSLDGWYIGPALESYRCYNIWIWDTRAVRICDTLTWYPTKVRMPASSTTDTILACLQDIAYALQNPSPASALAPRTDTQSKALIDLITLLTNIAAPALRVPLLDNQPAVTSEPVPIIVCPPQPAPSLRVATPEPVPLIVCKPPYAPSLRVASPSPRATDPSMPALVVPDDSDSNDSDAEDVPTVPSPHVRFSTPPVADTYAQVTGPRGRTRRRAQRKAKATPKPPAPPALHIPPTLPNNRRRSTRKRRATLKARAAKCTTTPLGNDLPPEHWCCHGTAVNPDTGNIAQYKELSTSSDAAHWQYSNTDEIGRMFQGLGPDSYMPTGTNTLWFIDRKDIPKHKKPTYVRVVCADRPEKPNTRRVRWTAGGDRIDYPGNKTTKTADISTCKLMFNSVISTPKGRFMTIDLKDFYLCSDLTDYEYVRIPRHMLPDNIIDLYNLEPLIVNDYVYAEVRKGMYGLPQAGKLANDALVKYLAPHGFIPCDVTPGLWRDTTSDLMFTLVVDDFGVRYTDKATVDRLLNVLQQEYKCSTDWTGERYVGLTLAWDYDKGTCDISMPGYIIRALSRFRHPRPRKPEHSPHPWNAPVYGSRQQYVQHDNTPFVDASNKLLLQEVLGTLLYYARCRWHHDTLHRHHCDPAIHSHHRNHARSHAIAQLLRHPSRCHRPLHQKRHALVGRERRFLPFRK
jgi:hypothetical protein